MTQKNKNDFPAANIMALGREFKHGLLPPGPFQKLESLLADITPAGPIVPLHVGEPDGGLPDFVKPIFAEPAFYDGFGKYPELLGSSAHRTAIKNWATRRYHLPNDFLSIDPPTNNILPTVGSREGLALAINYAVQKKQQRLKNERPLVIITSPFYHVYHASGIVAGADVIAIHCFDESQLDKNHVAKKLSLADGIATLSPAMQNRIAAIVVCTPDNPTSRILTLTEMEHLHDIAHRHGAFIISDECYGDLHYGVPPISFLNHAANGFGLGQVIISNSLSKRSGAPGLRAGVLLGDGAVIAELANLRAHLSAIPPRSLQLIATALWNDDAHVASAREKYQARARVAASIIGHSPSFQMPSAGFFLYLRFTNDGAADEATSIAAGARAARAIFAATGIKLLPAVFMAGGNADDVDNPASAYARLSMIVAGDAWPVLLQNLKPYLLPDI
ncbi:MAG: aminotransferase class I/II-fold pyridoxal phosphate-dependent enzyme [Hydrotalea sp.]|nr:aminotransferase class I/II-fold pyridoxal phosphate-dependent enzyme [Hydrotalea sp.]